MHVLSLAYGEEPPLPSDWQTHDTTPLEDAEPSREPGRIVNFFRSIFRRHSQQRPDQNPPNRAINGDGNGNGSANGSAVAAAATAAGAAAAAEVQGALRHQARLREARVGIEGGGGGGGGGGGEHLPAAIDGVDGLASFAIRDFLQFLQPVLVGGGPDLTGGMASLERALAWPVGGAAMGDLGGAGGVVARRRLQHPSADEAQEELQFNGLMLAPYQVSFFFSVTEARRGGGRG